MPPRNYSKESPTGPAWGFLLAFHPLASKRITLQRLFSTFADSWPGKGLMLLRLAVSTFLVQDAYVRLQEPAVFIHAIPQLVAAGAGISLLMGLWTPVAGTLAALLQTWIAFSQPGDVRSNFLAAAIASGLALVGPGAWWLDALLFGRKRICIQDR